jgi:ribosomal protein S18 acetylase RimI-like enzyme
MSLTGDDAVYRVAVPRDAAAIAGIHVRGWHDTYTGTVPQSIITAQSNPRTRLAEWERRLRKPGPNIIIVLEITGVVRGFVWVGAANPKSASDRVPGYSAYMSSLYVDRQWHRLGYGRNLVLHAATALSARRLRSLGFHVVAANPARGFYEKLGARLISTTTLGHGAESWTQCAYGWRDITELRDQGLRG